VRRDPEKRQNQKAELCFVFRHHTSCLDSLRNSLGGSFFCRVKPSHKPRTTPKLNRVIFNLLLSAYYGIIVTIGRERFRANEATIAFNSVEAIIAMRRSGSSSGLDPDPLKVRASADSC
jgi:hypothetical protein